MIGYCNCISQHNCTANHIARNKVCHIAPKYNLDFFQQIVVSTIIEKLFHLEQFAIYVTRPGKTGLIYTKYTCLYYGTYLLFSLCYPKSVNFIKFLMDFCIYGEILNTIQITDKKSLHFKLSKSGQSLHVDKTCFPRPGHILFHFKFMHLVKNSKSYKGYVFLCFVKLKLNYIHFTHEISVGPLQCD